MPAAGSDLFEDLHLDPHRTAVSFEQGPYGGRDDVFFDISGEFHPAAVTDFESFGIFRNAHFQHVAHAVERKAHHIETAPQIRDRSRRENLNMFHTNFFDELNYPCLIFCFRSGSLGRDVHTQVCGRNIDY